VAIILHCHYEDLIEQLFDRYLSAAADADLFVTTRLDFSVNGINIIRRRRPNVFIQCVENRGRDIRPFLFALRRVQTLGYLLVCKIHTKKASHMGRGLGEQWRQDLMDPLLGSDNSVSRVVRAFSEQSDLGLLAPEGSIMDLRRITANMFNTIWLVRLLNRMDRPDLIGNYAFQFPAGSMYWFRVAALAGLDDFVLAETSSKRSADKPTVHLRTPSKGSLPCLRNNAVIAWEKYRLTQEVSLSKCHAPFDFLGSVARIRVMPCGIFCSGPESY